jgi:hypothetical protein
MTRFVSAALAALLATAPPATADTPIRDLRAERGLRVTGTVAQVFGNYFVLEDGSGALLVDTGPAWYRRHRFEPGETLTVVGELDGDAFEAFRVIRGESVLDIRPPQGPPPWAGRAGRGAAGGGGRRRRPLQSRRT